ncbi:AAA family ATPase [Pyxidicoccus fallax]|uniref:AAA family ATPase n=1 Tax=Pyxidicoccus fallax TaxID=394095 RepID=A0A848LFR2_9BACT|nr:AAA family ATPase [Pyxidicoccus fallax]NMO17222.1 AAA family ATPase [Pyxidicoccus fallax]NPC79172.1 AAA family ATPase [Pyxidicoccus fallax]
MSQRVPEESLPVELSPFAAVEAAYPAELGRVCEALLRGLPVMIEADKELTPFFYKCLRDRLKKDGKQFLYLDGRPAQEPPPGMPPPSMMATLIGQLRDAVRGAVRERIIVLPHLDLLTTSSGGLTSEAREVIPLLYENPEMVWVGFKDPSFPLPRVIENLFPHKESILGVSRDRLRYLITQRESRKFGRGLQPYSLYKHVSGVNAVRLRRLLGAITGEDYPTDARPAYAQLRTATLTGNLSVPELDLHGDIGGYAKVKQRLQQEILDVLAHKDTLNDPEAVKRVEALLPRGMIFWGPPGTGKTLFAKAMASALGAAVQVVSGPELKSRWVGESEENLRQIFVRARQAAPSIIVFDELDSFAAARGTFTGSGVEHSMVNQLLTEMDGFRKEELVFVVGTTNFVESLDPALLRPGRFEFQLCIPYPNSTDRRAILSIYDKKLGLAMTERAMDYAVKRTGDLVEGTGTRFSGDHIQALCRALARRRLRDATQAPTEALDVERALTEFLDRPELTPAEEKVVATHEAGHAVCALFCPHAPAIDRISIRGDLAGSLGFVQYADPAHRYVVTRGQILDGICMLFGGREAEALLLDDLSLGSAHDLQRATEMARELVEELGMGGDRVPVRRFEAPGRQADRHALSDATRSTLEAAIEQVLAEQRARARDILQREKARLVALRDLLIERKVLDREAFTHLAPAQAPKKESALG